MPVVQILFRIYTYHLLLIALSGAVLLARLARILFQYSSTHPLTIASSVLWSSEFCGGIGGCTEAIHLYRQQAWQGFCPQKSHLTFFNLHPSTTRAPQLPPHLLANERRSWADIGSPIRWKQEEFPAIVTSFVYQLFIFTNNQSKSTDRID